MFPEVWKSKTVYNVIPYKSKVVYAEEDILNFTPIRQKINSYPSKENKFGDDYSMVLIYDKNFGDTIIFGDTYLRGNIIM